MNVLHLQRTLQHPPQPAPVAGVTVRNYLGRQDIELWLALRNRAFAGERLGIRRWQVSDFESEFLAKAWWRPERLWLAESDHPDGGRQLVGTVALAMRVDGEAAVPVVHWLAVLPGWRRRGLGRLLVQTLEAYCWRHGYREVRLETHAQWQAAARFYQTLGYEPVQD
jgi:GNAT superfamily N-acetyltransferase